MSKKESNPTPPPIPPKKNLQDDVEMMSQPLMTDEGFLNEACMNELGALLARIPKEYDRLADDPEWSTKKDMWIFKHDIVGAFAKCACIGSPYDCPDHLNEVCGYLNASLATYFPWDENNMCNLSLCEINKALHDILADGSISYFDAWNEPKKDKGQKIKFVSRLSGPEDPDYDYICIDALLRNVCLDIRMERRANRVFDRGFEQDWSDTWPIDYQI